MSNKRDLHYKLIDAITERGVKYGKPHGNWYFLSITPNLWFELDTWNKAVRLSYGTPELNREKIERSIHNAFRGTTAVYAGSDFGGYESELDEKQYLELINLINEKT